jgi:hypothetical protein
MGSKRNTNASEAANSGIFDANPDRPALPREIVRALLSLGQMDGLRERSSSLLHDMRPMGLNSLFRSFLIPSEAFCIKGHILAIRVTITPLKNATA